MAIPSTRKRSTTVTSPLPPGLQRRRHRRSIPLGLRMTRKEDLVEDASSQNEDTLPQEPTSPLEETFGSVPSLDGSGPSRQRERNP
jgi:hypothetical protein